MAAFESGSAFGIAAITKYGWIKLATLGAAFLGAGMMAAFRPPKTRRELFLQSAVALGSSFLFGDTICSVILHTITLIDVASFQDYLNFQITIHGLVGALSWGIFGGMAHLRDKIGKRSLDESINDIRNSV